MFPDALPARFSTSIMMDECLQPEMRGHERFVCNYLSQRRLWWVSGAPPLLSISGGHADSPTSGSHGDPSWRSASVRNPPNSTPGRFSIHNGKHPDVDGTIDHPMRESGSGGSLAESFPWMRSWMSSLGLVACLRLGFFVMGKEKTCGQCRAKEAIIRPNEIH